MKFYRNLVLLLILPVFIILLCFGIVKLLNTRSMETDPQTCRVQLDREIHFPWDSDVIATIRFDPTETGTVEKPLGKTNILLIVDNSGSMGGGPGSKFETAKDVLLNFIENFAVGPHVKIGVILFDDQITDEITSTQDFPSLKTRLNTVTPAGGGTDFTPPLNRAADRLAPLTGENNIVVFLTDGGAGAEEPNRVYRERLLKKGVDVFMVGVGKDALYDVLRAVITDDNGNVPDNRVLTCDDYLKLQVLFDDVGREIGNVAGQRGEMFIPVADDVFQWLDTVPENVSPGDGRIVTAPSPLQNPHLIRFGVVFAREYMLHLPMEPQAPGIIKPFYHDVSFDYIRTDGTHRVLPGTPVPYLLAVTYAALFLLYLPAALYLLFSLLGKKRKEPPLEPGSLELPFPREDIPGALPRRHIHPKAVREWIPTLVIGLGNTGRHILTHLKQNVLDGVDDGSDAVLFLAVDTAQPETGGPDADRVPGTVTPLDEETEIYVPAPHIRDINDVVRRYESINRIDITDPFTALSLGDYARTPEDLLSLGGGTRRNPALARAYLLKELAQGEESGLLMTLKEKIETLNRYTRSTQLMQVLIAGNTNGGVGSGLMGDMAVLARRLTDALKDGETSVQIDLLLVEDRCDQYDPRELQVQNRELIDQLDFLSQAGRISIPWHLGSSHSSSKPQSPARSANKNFCGDPRGGFIEKSPLAAGGTYHEIRNGILEKRPYTNAYVFSRNTSQPQFDLFPAVADSALFLIDRTARMESRHLMENFKTNEAEARRNGKIEQFTYIRCGSVFYPLHVIKENLTYLFLKDIFSPRIALAGLNMEETVPVIVKKGKVDDLMEHSTVLPLWRRETDAGVDRWAALLRREDCRMFRDLLMGDCENFRRLLETAFPILLNEGIYSLSGFDFVLAEIIESLRIADITDPIPALEVLRDSVRSWSEVFTGNGTDATGGNGLVENLNRSLERIENVKSELGCMENCRLVPGIELDAPEIYNIRSLHTEWLSHLVGTPDEKQLYENLKKRCGWEIEETGLEQSRLVFRIIGGDTHRFAEPQDFERDFTAAAREIVRQYAEPLKEITILELLREYDKQQSPLYNCSALARRMYHGMRAHRLLYLFGLPHPLHVRLDSSEEGYVNRLQTELRDIKPVEEVFEFPPSSAQYRLYGIQIIPLLQSSPQSQDEIKTFDFCHAFKKEMRETIRRVFQFEVPDLPPYYYLVFYFPRYFDEFVRLWAAGKINRDSRDRLWKVKIDGIQYKLTLFREEGLPDAAVHLIMNREFIPFASGDRELPPDPQRLRELEDGVERREPFCCWMKLHLDGEEVS